MQTSEVNAAALPPAGGLRLGVLISGAGSTLANLLEQERAGRLGGARIVQVISSRSAVGGVAIARDAGLPVDIVRRREFPDVETFSAAIEARLSARACDLALLAGFLCYWRLSAAWMGRVLNIHPALLPRFGGKGMYGRHVHEAVLSAGERESGCTVHLVDNEYDHGLILAQARVPVLPEDTPDSLAARVMRAERELYPAVVRSVASLGSAWRSALSGGLKMDTGVAT